METRKCQRCGSLFTPAETSTGKSRARFCSKSCRSQTGGYEYDPNRLYCCSYCKEWLKADSFGWYHHLKQPRNAFCKVCNPIKRREHYDKNKNHARETHRSWRNKRVLEPGDAGLHWLFKRQMSSHQSRARKKGLPCTVDPEYLVGLYHKQDGRCYYTGRELLWGRGKARGPDTMSLDRLDPRVGYIPSNVVLCTYLTNTTKQDRTEKEFYEYCREVLDIRDSKK